MSGPKLGLDCRSEPDMYLLAGVLDNGSHRGSSGPRWICWSIMVRPILLLAGVCIWTRMGGPGGGGGGGGVSCYQKKPQGEGTTTTCDRFAGVHAGSGTHTLPFPALRISWLEADQPANTSHPVEEVCVLRRPTLWLLPARIRCRVEQWLL